MRAVIGRRLHGLWSYPAGHGKRVLSKSKEQRGMPIGIDSARCDRSQVALRLIGFAIR